MNTVTPSLDIDDEYECVYTVNKQSYNHPPTCLVEIEGKQLSMMIDTGATVNLIDEATYNEIDQHRVKQLKKTGHNIYSYGSTTPLPVLGMITSTIRTPSATTIAHLHVVKGNAGNLLSYDTAKLLNLLTVSVNTVDEHDDLRFDQQFECLFGGIGKVKGRMVKLHINPAEKPKQQPHVQILDIYSIMDLVLNWVRCRYWLC